MVGVLILVQQRAFLTDCDSADAWSRWEVSTSRLIVDPAYIAKADDPKW